MDNKPRLRLPERHDHLKHFEGDHPGWKLAALLVWKLPLILSAAAAVLYWGAQLALYLRA